MSRLDYWVWRPVAWVLLGLICKPLEWAYKFDQWRHKR